MQPESAYDRISDLWPSRGTNMLADPGIHTLLSKLESYSLDVDVLDGKELGQLFPVSRDYSIIE